MNAINLRNASEQEAFKCGNNCRCCRSRVRSSTVAQAQQAVRQAEDVRPLTSLLVPAVAAFVLSNVIDGKGMLRL